MAESKIRIGQVSNLQTQLGTIYTQANNAYEAANTANGTGAAGYSQANVAYAQANAARDQANSAYGQANLAYDQANAAYLAANNANLLLGGVITGTLNVTQDIIVGGNVYLEGNTTFINVTTYSIEDSLIYLASNNQLTDSVDIGFMGGKNTSGTYAHTGLARDATDGKWKLFDGLPEEGHVGNVINFNNSYLATLVANVEANTLSVVNGVSGNVDFDNGTLFVDSVENRIGIGTTIPPAKLSVYDSNFFTVTPNYTAYQTIPSGVLVATKNAANLSFIAASTGGEAGNGINIIAYSGSQWHRGLTYNNKSGVPDLLLQQDGGNVGIGSTTPTANLDVVGTANVSSNTIILGSVGVGGAISSRTKLDISGTMTSSANTTLGILNRGIIPAAANSTATMFQSQPSTEAATFTLDTLNHYFANTTTLGTNSVLTTQHGFIVGSSFTQAANNIGFRSDIPENGLSHFGANNWNLYVGGTANNFIQGNLFFSSLISSGVAAEGKIFIGGILPRFSGDRGLGFRLRANIANTAFGESIGFWSAIGAETTTFGSRLGITHFRATQVGTLPGSPNSIQSQHGFYVDTTLVSALQLNIAFRGAIPDTGGATLGYSNTWNFYADGTASNYFRGKTGIGTRNPQANLDIFRSNTINTTTPGTTTYALHLTPENATVDTATGITFGAGDSSSGQTAQAGIYSQFSGSYGTKLYFATTNDYGVGAKTRMMIDHVGNVGIGTVSPAAKFHLYNGVAIFNNNSSGDSNSGLRIVAPVATTHYNWMLGAQQNVGNAFEITPSTAVGGTTFTTPVAVFTQAGQVGIGTASPLHKFHVFNNSGQYATWIEHNVNNAGQNFYDALFLQNANAGDDRYVQIGFSTNSSVDGQHHRATIRAYRDTDATYGGKLGFFTRANGGTLNERITINAAGNVGIGCTSPQRKLDVTGSGILASFGSQMSVNSIAGIHFGYSETPSNNDNYKKSAMVFERTDNHNQGGNASGKIHFLLHNTGSASASGTNSAVLTLDTDGNGTLGSARVGIGTTSPQNLLHMYGSDAFLRIQAAGGNYSYIRLDDGSTNGYLIKNLSAGTGNGALAGALYTYTDSNKAFQHIHAGTPLFTILSDGNVGIGTTSPYEKLHVVGSSSTGILYINDSTSGATTTGSQLLIARASTTSTQGQGMAIRFQDTAVTNNVRIIESGGGALQFLAYRSGWVTDMFINSSGNVGIGTTNPGSYKLYVQGDQYISGTLTEASSITLKENINPITNALDSVMQLVGVVYDRKDGSAKQRAGLIAEEVEQILPNVVQKDQEGNPSGIQYTNLIAYLVESIKELKAEIDELKRK